MAAAAILIPAPGAIAIDVATDPDLVEILPWQDIQFAVVPTETPSTNSFDDLPVEPANLSFAERR